MNKILKTMMLAAVTAFGLASCEDVPAPFIEPEMPGAGGGEDITLPYTSANLKDGFEVYTPTGNAWSLGNTYAKATGYNSGSTTASETYLISPAIPLGDAEQVYVDFKYVIAYTNSLGLEEGHQVLVCSEYNTEDPAASNWVKLPFEPKEREDRSSWEMYPANTMSIPADMLGKEIRIAFLYKCNSNSASTWELTDLSISTEPGGEVTPDTPDTPDTPTDGGDGSLENPFNAAAAYNYTAALPAGQTTSEKFYIKGIVCQSNKMDISVQYKNATFHISEDGSANGTQFLIFRTKGLNGVDITSEDDVQVGDEVVVYASLVNYMGNTPETAQGGIIYSQKRNGQDLDEGGDDTPDDGGDTPDVPTEGNLLSNGDFETWNGSTPQNWKSASSAGNATLSQSPEAHGGSYAVSVGYSSSANKRLAYQETTFAPGTYKFSFWAKGTNTEAGSKCQTRPGYVPMKADGTIDSSNYKYGEYATLSATEWTLVEHEFTLEAETTLCLVIMSPKNSNYHTSQNILVDDASLIKIK